MSYHSHYRKQLKQYQPLDFVGPYREMNTSHKRFLARNKLKDRRHDIEHYIGANTNYNRDFMPHNGRYYNRKKWLMKIGEWKYG